MTKDWEQRLVEAGYKITMPRRAVARVLLAADFPLSPQEIMAQGQEEHRQLGLVTVYRTLSLLMELGLVRRVHCEDGCHGYVAASPGHNHAVICRHCNRSVEFPGSNDLNEVIARVSERTGYQIEDHLLQLFGLCPACKDK